MKLESPLIIPNSEKIRTMKEQVLVIQAEFERQGYTDLPDNLKKYLTIQPCKRCSLIFVWMRERKYCSRKCQYNVLL